MKREPFFWISVSCGLVIMAFILLILIRLLTSTSAGMRAILFKTSNFMWLVTL